MEWKTLLDLRPGPRCGREEQVIGFWWRHTSWNWLESPAKTKAPLVTSSLFLTMIIGVEGNGNTVTGVLCYTCYSLGTIIGSWNITRYSACWGVLHSPRWCNVHKSESCCWSSFACVVTFKLFLINQPRCTLKYSRPCAELGGHEREKNIGGQLKHIISILLAHTHTIFIWLITSGKLHAL